MHGNFSVIDEVVLELVPGNLTVALLLPEGQYKWRQWKSVLCAWRFCCKVPETVTDALQRVSSLLENYIHSKFPILSL